jgi:UDP-N-acetylmuramoyl-L-alanine---L-glutamate ligase
VFRPTGFADLADKRVGIFGYGIEGRAAAARLRGVADLVIVDDAEGVSDEVLVTDREGLNALATCDVVLKSPGIPRRRPDVLELERTGVTVTSALNLWLHDTDLDRVVAVTGTKGKSTTTSLITFFLTCLGQRAQRLGNIGQPPYDPNVDTSEGWLVLEVSSFQVVDIDIAPRRPSAKTTWTGTVRSSSIATTNFHSPALAVNT